MGEVSPPKLEGCSLNLLLKKGCLMSEDSILEMNSNIDFYD